MRIHCSQTEHLGGMKLFSWIIFSSSSSSQLPQNWSQDLRMAVSPFQKSETSNFTYRDPKILKHVSQFTVTASLNKNDYITCSLISALISFIQWRSQTRPHAHADLQSWIRSGAVALSVSQKKNKKNLKNPAKEESMELNNRTTHAPLPVPDCVWGRQLSRQPVSLC